MRTYIQLLFSLIVPLSILFIVLSVAYFTLDYNFNKAMKLGVLIGFALGLGLSIILALFLTIMRTIQYPKNQSLKPLDNTKSEKLKKVRVAPSVQEKDTTKEKGEETLTLPVAEKVMLLMEKELAFEVTLNAIENQKLGNIISKNLENGLITFNTKEETQNITITALTKHTSEVIFQNGTLTDETQKIIIYLKEKELSFLDY